MNDAEASRKLGIAERWLSFWIACIRECFEEVGVLLANPDDPIIQNTKKLSMLERETKQ